MTSIHVSLSAEMKKRLGLSMAAYVRLVLAEKLREE